MSGVERACWKCGSFYHHEDNCDRVITSDRPASLEIEIVAPPESETAMSSPQPIPLVDRLVPSVVETQVQDFSAPPAENVRKVRAVIVEVDCETCNATGWISGPRAGELIHCHACNGYKFVRTSIPLATFQLLMMGRSQ